MKIILTDGLADKEIFLKFLMGELPIHFTEFDISSFPTMSSSLGEIPTTIQHILCGKGIIANYRITEIGDGIRFPPYIRIHFSEIREDWRYDLRWIKYENTDLFQVLLHLSNNNLDAVYPNFNTLTSSFIPQEPENTPF